VQRPQARTGNIIYVRGSGGFFGTLEAKELIAQDLIVAPNVPKAMVRFMSDPPSNITTIGTPIGATVAYSSDGVFDITLTSPPTNADEINVQATVSQVPPFVSTDAVIVHVAINSASNITVFMNDKDGLPVNSGGSVIFYWS